MYRSMSFIKLAFKFLSNRFFLIFCLFYFLVNYPYLLNYPTGLHFIRQTDSISFIFYYLHKSNFNFFDVGNLNLGFYHGKAACEFPIIYYMIFLVFKVFGTHLVIIRWLALICCTIGIYCLLKITNDFIKNKLLAAFTVLLVISSSVFRYYSVNFVPDTIALSFVFIGFYYFFLFDRKAKQRSFYLLFIFLTLATLIKIYFGIYLVALSLFLYLNYKGIKGKITKGVVLSLLSVFLWYGFSIYYNSVYNSTYYLTHSVPIWNMTCIEIGETINYISYYWYTKYYLPTSFHAFLVLIIVILILFKRGARYNTLLFICLAGVLGFLSLFFRQLKDHDYYFLPFIPLIYLVVVLSISQLLTLSRKKIYEVSITLTILLVSVLGFNYTSLNMIRRFNNNSLDEFSMVSYQLRGIELFIEANSIENNAKFLVIGDKTKNGSLVFLNRFGWTYTNFKTDLNSIKDNLSSADYLLVLSPSKNKIPEDILTGLKSCDKLTCNSNYIYSLRNYKRTNS